MTACSFINHVHYDMFRPVIATIIRQCYNCVKGKNWGTGLSHCKEEASNLHLIRYSLTYCSINFVIISLNHEYT